MYYVTIKVKSTPIWNKRELILPKYKSASCLLFFPAIFFLIFTNKIANAQSVPDSRERQMQAAFYAAETKTAAAPQIPERLLAQRKNRFYISGGHNANYMHYKEVDEDATLDENYGKTLGYYGRIGFKSARAIGALELMPFVEGYYLRFDGMNAYDGSIIGGGAFAADQRAEVHRYGLKIGGYHEFSPRIESFIYFDVGRRIWYRGENETVRGVLMYAEKYYWVYIGLGGGLNYMLMPKLSIGLELEFMASPDAKMRADLYEGGTFRLGGVAGWEIELPLRYYLLKNLSFDITPYLTFWNISESDSVLISGSSYVEPNSRTHIEGLLVGLTCIF